MQLTKKNLLLAIIFLYIVYCALSIGAMWDTTFHLTQGKNKLNYFFSFGKINKEVFFDKYIPGISFTITAFLTNIAPKKFEYETLRLINMFISLSGVYGISKITRLLFDKRVAVIVFLLFLFYPVYFGHMAINPKDTIFSISFIWITYFVLQYLIKNEKYQNNIKHLGKISFLIALGTGVRLTFAGILIPIIIFTILEIFYFKKFINKNFSIKIFCYDCLKIFLISYVVLILFWPQVYTNIFVLPYTFFIEIFNIWIAGPPASMLNGEIFLTSNVPNNYILLNFLLKTPEYILALYIFSIYFIIAKNSFFKKKYKNFNYKIYLILFVLTVINIIFTYSPYPLYDGMRLFMFLISFFIIIPALGFNYIISNLEKKIYRLYLVSIIVLIIVFAYKFFSLTPYHYVYLNYLNGKTSNNINKFENDYLGVSVGSLFKKSSFLNKKKTKLAFCGVGNGKMKRLLNKNKYSNVVIRDTNQNYDYILLVNRVNWNTISDIKFARTCFDTFKGKNISEVKRNGLVLSTIRKKPEN